MRYYISITRQKQCTKIRTDTRVHISNIDYSVIIFQRYSEQYQPPYLRNFHLEITFRHGFARLARLGNKLIVKSGIQGLINDSNYGQVIIRARHKLPIEI